MNCINKDLIQKYIDKEATLIEVLSIKKHLKICPSCVAEVEYRRRLAQNAISFMNQLVDQDIIIPEFIHPKGSYKKRFITPKRIIYSISAACALLLALLAIDKFKSKDDFHVTVVNSLGAEVDANLPATEQDMVIKVIDQHGNVTEFPLN